MNYNIEYEREEDGRWIAEVAELHNHPLVWDAQKAALHTAARFMLYKCLDLSYIISY